MSQETTTFAPIISMFPWSDTDAPDSAIKGIRPMGNLLAIVDDGAIAIPSSGDNQAVRCDLTLPPNFMYALQDLYVGISGAGLAAASNWELVGGFRYQNSQGGVAGTESFSALLSMTSPGATMFGVSGLTWEQAFQLQSPMPKFLQTPGSTWDLRLINLTNDDIVAQLNYVASFLMFTINQEFDAGVNTPLLTR